MAKDYLSHHGVLGQKWGIRRYQNEDGTLTAEGRERYGKVGKDAKIKSEEIWNYMRKQQEKEYDKNVELNKKIQKYRKQAKDLYTKYEFDGDDGGGGRTKADQRAGEKYMQILEKLSPLEEQAWDDAYAKGRKLTIEKYGTKRVNDIETRNSIFGAAITAAYLGVLGFATYKTIDTIAKGGEQLSNTIIDKALNKRK